MEFSKEWQKNVHSISPSLVGFTSHFPWWGIDPDIFFDDDGKVWYVGTAAPAKPNFPGEGGGRGVFSQLKRTVQLKKNKQQKMGKQKRQATAIAGIYRYLELLPFLFFLFGSLFFWVVFLGHQACPVPRGDLLPCSGPQGWCPWENLQQSGLHWQDLPTKSQRNEGKL